MLTFAQRQLKRKLDAKKWGGLVYIPNNQANYFQGRMAAIGALMVSHIKLCQTHGCFHDKQISCPLCEVEEGVTLELETTQP